MGQKVNPNGLRLGINKDWEAKWYSNKKDFEILGKSVKTFIVGSEQVFNTYMTRNRLNEYLLGFADMFSKRIAMSASFGVEDLQISDELKYRYKNYLKMFLQLIYEHTFYIFFYYNTNLLVNNHLYFLLDSTFYLYVTCNYYDHF